MPITLRDKATSRLGRMSSSFGAMTSAVAGTNTAQAVRTGQIQRTLGTLTAAILAQYQSNIVRTGAIASSFGAMTSNMPGQFTPAGQTTNFPPAFVGGSAPLVIDAVAGTAFSMNLRTDPRTAPVDPEGDEFTLSLQSGTLPSGWTFANDVLSGTVPASGNFPLVFRATENLSGPQSIPSLQDERDTYTRWGWSWTAAEEPNFTAVPTFYVTNVDVRNDPEGDDLWLNLAQYQRTGQVGYRDRAAGWARYYKDEYYGDIEEGHLFGWGLIDYFNFTGDSAYLDAARNIAANWLLPRVNAIPPNKDLAYYGLRIWGRALHLMTRMTDAEPSDARWANARDRLIDAWFDSPDWDDSIGIWYGGQPGTDTNYYAGAFAAGVRAVAPYQLGTLVEAWWLAYLQTGRSDMRARLLRLADFAYNFGLDPVWEYTGSRFGAKNGVISHNYSDPIAHPGGADFWDTTMSFGPINVMVMAYKLTGIQAYYDRAKYQFNRASKARTTGSFTGSIPRLAADNVVHHFVDTRLNTFPPVNGDTGSTQKYFAYNKGELQYTYMLFENGGLPARVS